MAQGFKRKYAGQLEKKIRIGFEEKFQAFSTGQMEAGIFLTDLIHIGKSLGVKPRLTPPMRAVLEYTETLSQIKGTKLFEELESFLTKIERQLIVTAQERELAEKYKQIRLLKDLVSLELTRVQWEQIKKGPGARGKGQGNFAHTPWALDPLFEPHFVFYELAEQRDQAFHKNLEALLKTQKTNSAIVIAGGFHAKGFEEALRANGYSYVVITPKMDSLEGLEVYQTVMQGKISYKDNLETTFYDAFIRHSSQHLIKNLNGPDLRKNLMAFFITLPRKRF